MPLALGTRLGPYEILAPVGAGGMGEVYRARDTRLGREVAVKVLPAELANDPERLRRFEQEAKAASALNHPGILTVHDFGVHEGVTCLVTELLLGESLREAMRRGPISPKKAIDVAGQIARGLAAAHEKGIIHRDLKPENLFATDDGRIKILDFGLARVERSELAGNVADASTVLETSAGTVLGTVGYMAPEQVRGERADARSDLFALGVVLHEMLAGANPFRRDSVVESLNAILNDEAPDLAATPSRPRGALTRIVSRLLAKRVEDRFQTARDLAFALAELASSPEPQPSDVTPASKSARQKTVKITAIAAGVLLLVALGALARWHSSRASREPRADALQPRALAVLPLTEIGEAGERYFGIGLADTLQNKLSGIKGVTVRPTSAVRKFAEGGTDPLAAGRELEVDAVLDGSVQRAAGRLRMNLRLLEVPGGGALWAESFDVAAGDLFAVQDEIATTVLARLEVRLDPEQAARLRAHGTSNPAAYEAYLRGKADSDGTGIGRLQRAIAHFDEALRLDPRYALAHAGRAHAATRIGLFWEPERSEWVERARRDVRTAMDLDPTLAEPHAVLCEIAFSLHGDWDLPGAVRHCREAQRLDPTVGLLELGTLYYHLGLEEPSLRALRRALEVDPTSVRVRGQLVSSLEILGHWEEATAEYPRLLGPDAFPDYALLWLGRVDEADRRLAEYLATGTLDERERRWARHSRLLVLARQGRHRDAAAEVRALAAEVPRRDRSFHHYAHAFAAASALARDEREAVRWLREMVATGMPNLPLVERDPHFDSIRQTAAYREFIAELRPVWEGYEREFR